MHRTMHRPSLQTWKRVLVRLCAPLCLGVGLSANLPSTGFGVNSATPWAKKHPPLLCLFSKQLSVALSSVAAWQAFEGFRRNVHIWFPSSCFSSLLPFLPGINPLLSFPCLSRWKSCVEVVLWTRPLCIQHYYVPCPCMFGYVHCRIINVLLGIHFNPLQDNLL